MRTGFKLPPEHDRRRKLTAEQREEIKRLYKEGGTFRGLGRAFGVDKGTIKMVVDDSHYKHMLETAKKRRADGRYKPTREEWAAIQRDHRRHMQSVYKKTAGLFPITSQ